MACKSEPSLKDQSNNARPVEQITHLPLHLHIMKSNMIDNERESVDQREDEEGVGGPAVEDLKSFVGDTCEESDPIGLARSCTFRSRVVRNEVLA
jgi:hypothetical protein